MRSFNVVIVERIHDILKLHRMPKDILEYSCRKIIEYYSHCK